MPRAVRSDGEAGNRRVSLGICIFLAAIVWMVFASTLRHDFVNYDDKTYVYGNSLVSAGLTSRGLTRDRRPANTLLRLHALRTLAILNEKDRGAASASREGGLTPKILDEPLRASDEPGGSRSR